MLESKLRLYARLSSEVLIESLKPGREGSLKAREDGLILDGHHRIRSLREPGIDVDSLEREIIPSDRDESLE